MRRRTVARLTATLTALAAAAAGIATGPTGAGAAPPTDAPVDSYVALGDSYTSAPLVPDVVVANGCYQSTANYPRLVADALGAATFTDASCSGADTTDMLSSQLPGVAPQLDAVTAGTDLVTLSIGGNDESVFGTLVGFCPTLRDTDPTGTPCRDAMRAEGRDRLYAAVQRTARRIDAVLTAVRAKAPDARIVVVGYPQIAPQVGTCPSLLPLADGDVRYAVTVNRRLDHALRRAAAKHGAAFADVWRASRGRDICSADPWINGQVTDPARAQSYHPFANEQEAVADLVLAELR